jgi:integrase
MAQRRRKKGWSHNAGERGKNWVRAYEKPDGSMMAEWFEPYTDPETDQTVQKRRRLSLTAAGITTRAKACAKVEQMAEEFGKLPVGASPVPVPLTVARLLTLYEKEVTPGKGESKQKHDRRAHRLWLAFFDAQPEPERRSDRHPGTLDRTDWDRFITARRSGALPEAEAVRDRVVQYDLKYLIAVLTWATGTGKAGEPYLAQHPWGAEKRRAQRWEMPKEKSPHRPAMTDEVRADLIRHAPHWQFALALELGRETISRNSSVRHLRWSDLDLATGVVRWRGEHDKTGREVETPLSARAVALLRTVPRGIGDAWVFGSETDPTEPTPRHTFQTWLRRAKARWLRTLEGEERNRVAASLRGLGFHGEKRAGVRANRGLPPKILEGIARTNYRTLLDVYDAVTVEEMRDAMQRHRAS